VQAEVAAEQVLGAVVQEQVEVAAEQVLGAVEQEQVEVAAEEQVRRCSTRSCC